MSITRPKYSDPRIIVALAKHYAPRVSEWLAAGGDCPGLEEVEEQVHEVLDSVFDFDPYTIARGFEHTHCYAPDKEFVDIFDTVDYKRSEEFRFITEQWVQENGIVPYLEKGDRVTVDYRDGWTTKEATGTIIEVRQKTGVYVVNVPELGHVDPDKGGSGTLGLHVYFENTRKAAT